MPLRWLMLMVLFLVRLAMGYQFQSVASVSTHLVSELGLTYTQVGTLIGFFLLHLMGTQVGRVFQNVVTTGKVVLILVIIGVGLFAVLHYPE